MEGARPFRDPDRRQCVVLLRRAFDAATGFRGGPHALAALTREPRQPPGTALDAGAVLERWTHDVAHHILVGTFDGEVVGIAAGHCTSGASAPLGVVDVVFVEPEARGVGIGTALVQELLEWFHAAGCRGVDAPALPGDRASKQLFESFGLSARLLVLHRRLP